MPELTAAIPPITVLSAQDWKDYTLLDSGGGRKLERFGPYTFVRPEHQAAWQPALPEARWQEAHAIFKATTGDETGGRWETHQPIPESWEMHYKALRFQAHFTSSRHLGVFPEQAAHWDWMCERIRETRHPVKVLNLFGYSGLATLAAAQAGAQVTHVDAAKKSVTWANENLALSGLEGRPVRWLVEDALKFVQREARRQSQYDGIILDPPKFGRGPKGEVWEVFAKLPELLDACRAVLSPRPLFFVITAYAIRASALSLYYALQAKMAGLEGALECGELVVTERGSEACAARSLSMAIFTRWRSLK